MTLHSVSNPQQISQYCSEIGSKIYCHPFKNTNELIMEYLSTKDGNCAHPTVDGDIIYKKGTSFYKFKKPSDDVFLNNIGATDAVLKTKENINNVKNYGSGNTFLGIPIAEIDTLNYIILDKSVELPKNGVFFMLTKKGSGQYLDFVAWYKHSGLCTYGLRNTCTLSHSGDILYNSHLIHSIKIKNDGGKPFVLGGVGYSKTPLMSPTFTSQMPTLCYFNRENHTIYVIPFQQTEAILGRENTTLASAVVEIVRDKIHITPITLVPEINRHGVVPKYNTGDRPSCGLIEKSFQLATDTREQEVINSTYDIVDSESSGAISGANSGANSSGGGSAEASTDGGISLEDIINFTTNESNKIELGSTVMDYMGNTDNLNQKFNPSLFGDTNPNVYYGSITPAETIIENFKDKINGCKLVILQFTEKDIKTFSEQCASIITQQINCLMILDVTFTSDIISTLENIKLSCTKFAGHCSIVLARCVKTKKLYWIRGIRWYSDRVYNFGEEFEEFDEMICGVLHKGMKYPIFSNKDIYFKGEYISISKFEEYISKKTIKELGDTQIDLVEAFVQLSVLVSTEQFNKMKLSCLKKLKQMQEKDNKTKSDALKMMLKLQQFEGDTSKGLQQQIDKLRHQLKQNRACVVLKQLTKTILGITSEGGASTKAASKSIDNTLRSEAVKDNTKSVNEMTFEQICEYVEQFDSFIIGKFTIDASLKSMLDSVSAGDFIKPTSQIASLHDTSCELDGFTVSALATHINDNGIEHDFKGILTVLCGHSERISSVPIAVLEQFSKLKDPRYFKWIEEVNDPDVAKYRILLRRMICEASINRDRQINPGSKQLTYFIIAMLISIAQSIKIKFTSIPTDYTDFTVVAMRTLLGYIFTLLASGAEPMSDLWQILSHYPTKVPCITAFKPNELWIVKNITEMIPYCMWSNANTTFKKNIISGITKMLGQYIITNDLKKIAEKEKLELEANLVEISKDLTIVWQWQKLVIISILKILVRKDEIEKDNYSIDMVKSIGNKLLKLYPDIDESQISRNHSNSNSTSKLKVILTQMITTGDIVLLPFQLQLIKDIISKRMHTFYHTMSKSDRKEYFNGLAINELKKELSKYKDGKTGPKQKWGKSWSFGYNDATKDYIKTLEETKTDIKELFTNNDISSPDGDGSATTSKAIVEEVSKEIVEEFHFKDLRQDKWIKLKTEEGIVTFMTQNKIEEITSILKYVFGDEINVNEIVIDICRELLIEYKDRVKAYSNIIDRYV